MWLYLFLGIVCFAIAGAVSAYLSIAIPYYRSEYYKQTKTPCIVVMRDKGKRGEYDAYKGLSRIYGYKKWLFNCYIPKDNGETTELDVILLHESGIYVFESKNYSGWIFGTETQQYWTMTRPKGWGKSEKYRFFNPIIQNKVHLKWMRNYLQYENLPIYSYIVFGYDSTLKNVTLTSNSHFVITVHDILPAVRSIAEKGGHHFSAAEIDALYEKLYPLTQVSDAQKAQHIENIEKNHLGPSSAKEGKLDDETAGAVKEDKSGADSGDVGRSVSNEDMIKEMEQENTPYDKNNVVANIDTETNIKDDRDTEVDANAKLCPRCGEKLVIRIASKGEYKGNRFWGCSNYPSCRYIENITSSVLETDGQEKRLGVKK